MTKPGIRDNRDQADGPTGEVVVCPQCQAIIPLPWPPPSLVKAFSGANTTTIAPCGVQDHADNAQIVGAESVPQPEPAPPIPQVIRDAYDKAFRSGKYEDYEAYLRICSSEYEKLKVNHERTSSIVKPKE